MKNNNVELKQRMQAKLLYNR